MNSNLSFTVHDDLPEEGRLVDDGLGRFNDENAPLQDVRPLSCFVRLRSGQVIGGAIGRTWGECCELQKIWVDAGHRRQGIATGLVREIERHALTRGCRTFYLETFSFQAPALYRALGYEVVLELRGFPDGIVKFLMIRHVRE